jgi:hypothetical protein
MASLVSTAARGAELAVATERLDDFVERIGLARLDWIKVDIQGAEPLFLRGAERTLERFGPDLTLEISPSDLGHMGADGPAVVGWLEERGYRGYELERGRVGPAIHARSLDPSFAADNVYFTRRGP